MALLNIQNLFLKYNQTDEWLIKDMNFVAEKNEIILIKGSNGCGKTSLLSMLCGIIPKTIKGIIGGQILIDDIDISALTLPELSPLISVVFQEPEMQLSFPQVEQELAFGPENLKVPANEIRKRIENISELLGISNLVKSEIATLSYGQKKLVAVAAVFSLSPDIILLDELADGLSDTSIQNIKKCIQYFREDKLIIISSTTHTFNDIADRIITFS
ncbi:MAG: ABC transporter ATP-binding protein [Candidatus Celaenobacter antarcticus]|nr:ABC transporter ATP-binding protein [Candidatus Celaenobacter antarcticus]